MTDAALPPPRIVLDTNVCLDLLLFRDPGCAALMAALRGGAVRAVTRADCRDEWRRVLHYPQLPIDETNRAGLEIEFDALIRCLPQAQLPADEAAQLPRCADPDDQKFMELAWAARASWLLSKDNALLKLTRRTERVGGFPVLLPRDWTATRA